MVDVTLLETQSMAMHDVLYGLQRIIVGFFMGNIFKGTEVVRLWRGALFFTGKQKNGAI